MRINPHLEFMRRVRFCDPTGGFATMGVMMAMTAASGAMAAYGQNQQAKATANMYRDQAGVMDQQAEIARKTADRNITNTQLQASQEAKELTKKVGGVQGAAKAALGASGVGSGSVTAADIITSNYDKAKLDEIAIRYNADSRSADYDMDAKNKVWAYGVQKNQYLAAANNARQAGNINTMNTLLSTATSMASIPLMYGGGSFTKVKTPKVKADFYDWSPAKETIFNSWQ